MYRVCRMTAFGNPTVTLVFKSYYPVAELQILPPPLQKAAQGAYAPPGETLG